MAFPTLLQVLSNVTLLVVGVPIVYLLSKALKLRPKPLTIVNARKEATSSVFLVIIATFVVTSALVVFVNTMVNPSFQLDKRPSFSVDHINVLLTAFFYVIWVLPLIMVMKRTGQSHESIGISGKDRWRMLALGFILSAISFTVLGFLAPSSGGGFTGFSPSQAYGLIVSAIIGFSEEIVFRGYIQTRLIAYSSTLKGLVVTSLLFALLHFPTRYFRYSGVALEALTNGTVGFSDSLNELVNHNLILAGTRTRKMDVEFLKTVYGFNSTLGSHSAARRPKPDMEQAILGLYVTESCICFLLKRLEAAKSAGITLTRWL